MDKVIARIASSTILIVIFLSLMVACNQTAPTSVSTPSAEPATATPIPTHTPLPPTNTPEPTVTATPTATPASTETPVPPTHTPAPTKAVTPKPTQTKSAASVSPVVVSSKPSTLQKSNEQAFTTAQAIVGLLDQMLNGGGIELCAPLIEKYQSLQASPTYNVAGESSEAQQAYGLYRQGIDHLAPRSATVLACGQGSGAIGGVELGFVRQTAGRAVDFLGRARDLLNRAPGVSTLSPLESAIARLIRSAQGLIGVLDTHRPGTYRNGSTQFGPDSPVCTEVTNYHTSIQPFEMNPADQSASVQAAYQLYREALNFYGTDVSSFAKMCVTETVTLSNTSIGNIRPKLVKIVNTLNQAQAMLKQ